MTNSTPDPAASAKVDVEAEIERRVAERLAAGNKPRRAKDDIVDLDALRAARAEKIGQRQFRLGGEVVTLCPELPIDALEAVQRSDIKALVEALSPDAETSDYLAAQKLTLDDLLPILDEYGVSLGESLGSPDSSQSTPGR